MRGTAVIVAIVLAIGSSLRAEDPRFDIAKSSFQSQGDAFERLVQLVPRTPPCADAPYVVIEIAGRTDGDAPFELSLRIEPGPSVQAEDTVLNLLTGFTGRFAAGSGAERTTWEVRNESVDAYFPKSYLREGKVGFLLPGVFRDVDSGRAPVHAVLTLKCAVKEQTLDCVSGGFGFGDALAKAKGSDRTAEDLLPKRDKAGGQPTGG